MNDEGDDGDGQPALRWLGGAGRKERDGDDDGPMADAVLVRTAMAGGWCPGPGKRRHDGRRMVAKSQVKHAFVEVVATCFVASR